MTRAKDEAPTRRIMCDFAGNEYVVTLFAGVVEIRPKGSRAGSGAKVDIGIGTIYNRALIARTAPILKRKK
jgi:hypothetical protein